MPADKKGAVKGDELALIAAWADAFDASHKGGAHEGHGGGGGHDHSSMNHIGAREHQGADATGEGRCSTGPVRHRSDERRLRAEERHGPSGQAGRSPLRAPRRAHLRHGGRDGRSTVRRSRRTFR